MKAQKKIEKTLAKSINKLADVIGHPHVIAGVFIAVVCWFAAGLFLEYDFWFDVIDLVIFISSFFLLFILQSSQNADTKAIHDKLDEIIDSLPSANKQKKREEKRLKEGDVKQ